MNAFLLTMNPALWLWDRADYDRCVARTSSGERVEDRWATGARTGGIEPGDRAFLLRQGGEPRGILGSGYFTGPVVRDVHWDRTRAGTANYAHLQWDAMADWDDPLPLEVLKSQLSQQYWQPKGSGMPIRAAVLGDLERLWSQHLCP